MQYRLSQDNLPKDSVEKALNLERYIEVEKERVTRSIILFHGVRFTLDTEALSKIKQAQETGERLEISRQLLADLRYYALIDQVTHLQSGLTFCTYYKSAGSQQALMRSLVATDGDIIHQIKSDCLENSDFCYQLASAHYWLIDQLLGKLNLRLLVKLNLISWLLSLLSVAGTVIPNLERMQENPWMWLGTALMSWLLQVGIKRLLLLFLPTVRRWVLRRLLSSLLSDQSVQRRMAKGVLGWLGS